MSAVAKPVGLQQVLHTIDGWKANCGSGALAVLNAIAQCRTQTLGYHLYRCSDNLCDREATVRKKQHPEDLRDSLSINRFGLNE